MPGPNIHSTLSNLRNTRDLRAEIATLAAKLAANTRGGGRLTIVDPAIAEATIRREWDSLLPALAPAIRARMKLEIKHGAQPSALQRGLKSAKPDLVTLGRPNYRFEVLRLLLAANLGYDAPPTIKRLVEQIGASQTPIREALAELKRTGLAHPRGRGIEIQAEDISVDLLAKMRALPQTLRLRFERGAKIKSPATLLQRVLTLLGSKSPTTWRALSLSGTPAALSSARAMNLMGTPRLDLVAHVPREAKTFDINLLRQLDDGLELEPSVVAPAPVVITLVRADTPLPAIARFQQARCAAPADVFLSLLDLGLRDQALQYAKAVRR